MTGPLEQSNSIFGHTIRDSDSCHEVGVTEKGHES